MAHVYFGRSPDGQCKAAVGINAEMFKDPKHLNLVRQMNEIFNNIVKQLKNSVNLSQGTCWIISEWAMKDCEVTKHGSRHHRLERMRFEDIWERLPDFQNYER